MKKIIYFSACAVACIALLFVLLWHQKRTPNAADQNPLTIAAMNGDLETLKALESKGFDLNARDTNRFGWTPLITATYFQQSNIIAYLLFKNVDVSVRDTAGNSALIYAIGYDDTNAGRLLLQHSDKMVEGWTNIANMVKTRPSSNIWLNLLPRP